MAGPLAIFLLLLRFLNPVEGWSLSPVEGYVGSTGSPTVSCRSLSFVEGPVAQEPDTLKASVVSSTYGSLVAPQRISPEELRTTTGVSEAVRRFAGVQLRDYGGLGGLKTVNVRSLGSEHTGVFIDGIQVDNAQNMQVDLGRFGLESFGEISLFPGHKTSSLQGAKEYSSASALYLESAAPVFSRRRRDNLKVGLRAGSFGTFSPGVSWEHGFRGGVSVRLSGEAVDTKGEYRFHVSDYRTFPDGSIHGYDTTMTRRNCDLRSLRLEGGIFGPSGRPSSWRAHVYYFDSERGLPGPVYKRAGEYPLSEDRQSDRDFFAQGRWSRTFDGGWSVMGKAKCSFSHLEYVDFPELRPDLAPARFNYRNHSAYASAAVMKRLRDFLRLDFAQDFQYDYLDADLKDFAYPGRLSSWTAMSAKAGRGRLEATATVLYLLVRDSFLSGGSRGTARRDAVMPSAAVRWRISERLNISAFAKRSYRMPTFNDLYYTTVGSKTLDPEDATQLNLSGRWTPVVSNDHWLSINADVYRNYLKNKIIAVPTSNQFRWSMYNIGMVRVLGAELSADGGIRVGKSRLGATGRYTYQSARDRTTSGPSTPSTGSGTAGDALRQGSGIGGQIPYIPLHSGSVNLYGEFSLWRLDVTAFATGERYTTSVNLPAYRLALWTTLDATLSRTFRLRGGSLATRLSLSNLLNEQYEIVDNYPMPGLGAMLKVEYSF